MLCFKIVGSDDARTIQVYVDEDGLRMLVERINDSRKHGHVHLLTAENGGRELHSVTPFGEEAVGEVIIDWEGDEGESA